MGVEGQLPAQQEVFWYRPKYCANRAVLELQISKVARCAGRLESGRRRGAVESRSTEKEIQIEWCCPRNFVVVDVALCCYGWMNVASNSLFPCSMPSATNLGIWEEKPHHHPSWSRTVGP